MIYKNKVSIIIYENREEFTMKDKKSNKTTKQLFALALVLVVLLGGTYAWLTLQVTGEKTNVLKAGSLSLVLDDTTSEGIKLEKAVPISDEKGKTGTEYTFTLQNKGTKAASYTIYLDDVALEANETRMDDSKLKYQLTKNSKETVALLSTLSDKVLDSGTIDGSTTNTYSLRVWIDSAAKNEVMGTILSKQLRVEVTQAGAKASTTAMCKRATTLHKEVCTNSDSSYYCQADGYSLNSEIEYGSLGTKGTLTSGDAFDCDVNGDGEYDPETERFYYVSDATNGITTDSDTAVLIYYSNVSGGVPSNSSTYAYGSNINGPVTAVKQLPTTTQWKTKLTNTKRQITTETGITSTKGGTLSEFSYEGYAARLLTAQEVNAGCGITISTAKTEELSTKCKYLMENTKYSNSSNKAYGEWLESPRAASHYVVWGVYVDNRSVSGSNANTADSRGSRPAIEVLKSDILY